MLNKTNNQYPSSSFNYDTHVKELNERFGRLIKQLGVHHHKGTPRYNFEVDFSYAIHEINTCPFYLQGKMFDKASGIVSSLINELKIQRDAEESVAA